MRMHPAPLTFATSLVLVLAVSSCGSLRTRPEETRVTLGARIEALLEAYESNDADRVLAMLDPAGFTLYGSDVSEIVRTPDELRQLMADDFALWRTADFGALRDVDLRLGENLATGMFHVPFSAGGRPPVIVRFSTTWRRHRGQWVLTQSANTVPTVGSAARELLQRQGGQ